MTTVHPGILEMVETGDLIIYRDATGKSYTVRDIINLKKDRAYTRIRPSLVAVHITLPDIPENISVPDLVPRPIRNADLAAAMTAAHLSFKINDTAAFIQDLFPANDDELLRRDYPTAITTPAFLETLLGDVPTDKLEETMLSLFSTGLLDTEGPQKRLLTYSQSMRNVGANKSIYAATRGVLQVMLAEDENNPLIPKLINLLKQIIDIANTHFYGSGSVLGQIGRLAKGFEVREAAVQGRGNGTLWDDLMDRDTFFKIQDDVRHIGAIPTNDPINIDPMDLISSPTIQLTDLINGNTIDISLLHINKTADAGYPWEGNASKGDTILADIMLLKYMFDRLKALDAAGQPPTDFVNQFSWTMYHKLKAKAEIYEHNKMYTKVRNISVPASVITIMPQLVFKLVKWSTSTFQRPLDRNCRNLSLMGYAPFRGGHERLITSLLDSEARIILHYADNLFVYEHGRYASLDASSMEAIHTTRFIRLALEYLLARGFGAIFRNGEVMSGGLLGTIAAWLVHSWFGNIAANSPGVLRSFVISVPGMASGMPGTFEFNDMLMAALVHYLLKLPADTPLLRNSGVPNAILLETALSLGFSLKTETSFPGPITARRPTLFQAIEEPWTPVTEDGLICQTDMLGFDTIYVKIGANPAACLAILNRTRLLKALTFNKSELRNVPLGPTTHVIIQLATINILYLSGGWAHADIALAIEITAKSLIAELSMNSVATSLNDTTAAAEITSMALARAASTVAGEHLLDESMAQGILRSMLGTGLLPLTQVFKIVHSEELSKQLLDFSLGHPRLTGEKLMRLVGPVVIAENAERLEATDATWVTPVLNAALRAMERLQPILQQPSQDTTGPSTSTLQIPPDTTAPPEPNLPDTTSSSRRPKRKRGSGSEAMWERVMRIAETELGPVPTEEQLADTFLSQIRLDNQLMSDGIMLEWDPRHPDPVESAASSLAQRLDLPLSIMLERADTIGVLLTLGALELPARSSRRQRM